MKTRKTIYADTQEMHGVSAMWVSITFSKISLNCKAS